MLCKLVRENAKTRWIDQPGVKVRVARSLLTLSEISRPMEYIPNRQTNRTKTCAHEHSIRGHNNTNKQQRYQQIKIQSLQNTKQQDLQA